jgi:hypothetical protein
MHRADQITAGRDSVWIARDSAPHSGEISPTVKEIRSNPAALLLRSLVVKISDCSLSAGGICRN